MEAGSDDDSRNEGNTKSSESRTTTDEIKWKPLDIGQLKLNVDASVYENSNLFSISTVLRDHNGSFLVGKTMRFPGTVQVIEAEVVGVYETMIEVVSVTSQPIIIESGSLTVVQALQSRRANMTAHLMARVPCSLNRTFLKLLCFLCWDNYV